MRIFCHRRGSRDGWSPYEAATPEDAAQQHARIVARDEKLLNGCNFSVETDDGTTTKDLTFDVVVSVVARKTL